MNWQKLKGTNQEIELKRPSLQQHGQYREGERAKDTERQRDREWKSISAIFGRLSTIKEKLSNYYIIFFYFGNSKNISTPTDRQVDSLSGLQLKVYRPRCAGLLHFRFHFLAFDLEFTSQGANTPGVSFPYKLLLVRTLLLLFCSQFL